MNASTSDRIHIGINHALESITHGECTPGLTYVARGDDVYKIGMTKGGQKSLQLRLRYFNKTFGVNGAILIVLQSPCAVCLEKCLQGCFLDKRLLGMGLGQEIFALTDEDLQWIVDNLDKLAPKPVKLLDDNR